MKTTITKMMKDYMYYGENFKMFIKQDYPICKQFTNEELKALWNSTKEKMASDF